MFDGGQQPLAEVSSAFCEGVVLEAAQFIETLGCGTERGQQVAGGGPRVQPVDGAGQCLAKRQAIGIQAIESDAVEVEDGLA